jgi:nanoRNase/pAp phosphatase (c-di-AMP/oligoRNAs hydrolase)
VAAHEFTPRLLLILVREHTPDPSALGAANGLSEFVQMIGIAISPPVIRSVTFDKVNNRLPN